jgi:hypothetical protein
MGPYRFLVSGIAAGAIVLAATGPATGRQGGK